MAKSGYDVNTTFKRVNLATWEAAARKLMDEGMDRDTIKARLAGPFFAEVDAMILEDMLGAAIDNAAKK